MILAGIRNLYQSQDECNFDPFTFVILESLMLLEREAYFKSATGEKDSGNGTYLRGLKSLRVNSLHISMPRSRNGAFKPLLLALIEQQKEQVITLWLYRKGLSTRDVSNVIKAFFAETISGNTVNDLAESFYETRKKWEERPLDTYYKAFYCDALYTNLKRGSS